MEALGAITGLSIGWAIAAGALALAPVLVHVLARGRVRRMAFPGQRFVDEVVATGRRASRPHDLLTLLLRAGALASIALAFSGAAWSGPARPDRSRLIIVLDASASMSRVESGRSAFDRAHDRAVSLLGSREVQEAGVVVARRTPTPLLPMMSANLDVLRSRLIDVEATLEGADLTDAVAVALALAGDGESSRIVVLTDGQGAAVLAGRDDVAVVDFTMSSWMQNRAITGLDVTRDERGETRARVAIVSWGEVESARLVLEVDGVVVDARPAPRSGVAEFDLGSGNPDWATVRARFEITDEAPWDDARFAILPAQRAVASALVTREDPDAPRSSARMLRAAINPFDEPGAEPTVAEPAMLPGEGVLVIGGAGAWSTNEIDALASCIRAGAGVLWIVDSAAAHASLGQFLARHARDAGFRLGDRFELRGGASLRSVGGDWIDASIGDLAAQTSVMARSPVVSAPPQRVGLAFDDGAPAVVRTPIGRGVLMTLHFPVDPDRSTVSRTPLLPMLLADLIGVMTPRAPEVGTASVGAPVVIPTTTSHPPAGATLVDSSGRPLRIGDGSLRATALPTPGTLRALVDDVVVGAAVVHVDPRESEPTVQSNDAVPPPPLMAAQIVQSGVVTDLAPWLLLAGVSLLLSESLAMRVRRGAEGSA